MTAQEEKLFGKGEDKFGAKKEIKVEYKSTEEEKLLVKTGHRSVKTEQMMDTKKYSTPGMKEEVKLGAKREVLKEEDQKRLVKQELESNGPAPVDVKDEVKPKMEEVLGPSVRWDDDLVWSEDADPNDDPFWNMRSTVPHHNAEETGETDPNDASIWNVRAGLYGQEHPDMDATLVKDGMRTDGGTVDRLETHVPENHSRESLVKA